MKHTPLPWELDPQIYMGGYDHTIPHYRILGVIGGKARRTVADVGQWADHLNAENDARFIVHAVNSHKDLLETLEWLTDEIGNPAMPNSPSVDAIQAAHAAITKAKGE